MTKVRMSKRMLGLVLSVGFAALATVALTSYVGGLEDKALEGAESRLVFVAKDVIPAGMSADVAAQRALIERTSLPSKAIVEGAIGSLEEIRGKVAQVPIAKGEQILAARFVERGRAAGVLSIPEGHQAMSVEVEVVPGVAGFVQAGDHISMIAQLAASGAAGRGSETRVQFLLQDVEVLAVGRRLETRQSSGGSTTAATTRRTEKVLVTVAVTPAEAEKLAFAIFQGKLYFTLLPEGQQPVRTSGRTIANAFG